MLREDETQHTPEELTVNAEARPVQPSSLSLQLQNEIVLPPQSEFIDRETGLFDEYFHTRICAILVSRQPIEDMDIIDLILFFEYRTKTSLSEAEYAAFKEKFTRVLGDEKLTAQQFVKIDFMLKTKLPGLYRELRDLIKKTGEVRDIILNKPVAKGSSPKTDVKQAA